MKGPFRKIRIKRAANEQPICIYKRTTLGEDDAANMCPAWRSHASSLGLTSPPRPNSKIIDFKSQAPPKY